MHKIKNKEHHYSIYKISGVRKQEQTTTGNKQSVSEGGSTVTVCRSQCAILVKELTYL